LSQIDSSFLKGVYTDGNGNYTIDNLAIEDYKITVSYMIISP